MAKRSEVLLRQRLKGSDLMGIRPPCKVDGKDCEFRKPGCQDRCPAYKTYYQRTRRFNRDMVVENVLTENKRRFWRDVRQNGLEIGRRG